jgi:hypothetical protein
MVKQAIDRIAELVCERTTLAGFNCYVFDLPFLIRRAHKHGIFVPACIRPRYHGRSYWSETIIDLREEWLMGDRQPSKGTSGLDAVAKFLGLPAKLGSGKDLPSMTVEQRLAYLTRDLEITAALYRRIMGQDAPQSPQDAI